MIGRRRRRELQSLANLPLVRNMEEHRNNYCFYPRNLLQLSPCYRIGQEVALVRITFLQRVQEVSKASNSN